MFKLPLWRLGTLLVLALSLSLTACDSGGSDDDEEEPDPTPAAPTFAIASRSFTAQTGEQGIQFFVTPSENVTLTGISIFDPRNRGGSAAIQNVNIRAGQEEELQDTAAGEGYERVSGNWRFTFDGYPTARPLETFSVTTTLAVSAARPDQPPAERQ